MVLDEAGSFAGTFGLMHEDHAMLAGAMGWLPDDTRLFEAVNLARAAGIEYAFEFAEMKESTHINAMKFELTGESGKVVSLVGDSTGGGMIETKLVNGYPLRVKGDCYVNLAFDLHDNVTVAQMERITAHLAGCLESGKSCVDGKGALHFIKVAELPDLEATRAMLPGIQVELLKPVLPVITRPERKPQLFDTMTRWREIAAERKLPLWEVAIQYEMDATG
jgi:L-serine dehydratase